MLSTTKHKALKITVGVMGSAGAPITGGAGDKLHEKAAALGRAIAGQRVILLTGATTGLVYTVGRTARDAGVFHVGVSPANNQSEHIEAYGLPVDACDLLVYTGFGLKGRNVVLVRSCDIVLFIAGSMGALNEFTIAHDEGKVIGCLGGTGGVADEARHLLQTLSKETGARVFQNSDPETLIESCLKALNSV